MQEEQPQNEPGWVFKPGDQPSSQALPQPETSQMQPVESSPTPAPSLTPEPLPQDPSSQQTMPQPANEMTEGVTWTASEYIANPKSGGWFAILAICSVVFAVVIYILTRDVVSTFVTAILGIIVGVFAARQPHTLDYRLDTKGLTIGKKFYPYEQFKSFSIAQEHALGYISLLPLKRFMPPLAVHYEPQDEDRIAQMLASYLPYEDHKPDVVDNFTRRIRF